MFHNFNWSACCPVHWSSALVSISSNHEETFKNLHCYYNILLMEYHDIPRPNLQTAKQGISAFIMVTTYLDVLEYSVKCNGHSIR